jgi:hypothetical protein
MNSQMRRIDLVCKLIGPFIIGLVDGLSTKAAVIVNLGMNITSIPLEYMCIAQVCPILVSRNMQGLTHTLGLHPSSGTPESTCVGELEHYRTEQSECFADGQECCRIYALESRARHEVIFQARCLPAFICMCSTILYRSFLFWSNGYVLVVCWLHLSPGGHCKNFFRVLRSSCNLGWAVACGQDWPYPSWSLVCKLASRLSPFGREPLLDLF